MLRFNMIVFLNKQNRITKIDKKLKKQVTARAARTRRGGPSGSNVRRVDTLERNGRHSTLSASAARAYWPTLAAPR